MNGNIDGNIQRCKTGLLILLEKQRILIYSRSNDISEVDFSNAATFPDLEGKARFGSK